MSVIVSDALGMYCRNLDGLRLRVEDSISQTRARFPQLRKEFFLQREFQIGGAGAAARAHAHADGALDHLNVTQPPAHNELVEFRQALANINPVAMIALVLIQRLNGFRARIESLAVGGVGAHFRKLAQRFQSLKENVVERILTQAAVKDGMSFGR